MATVILVEAAAENKPSGLMAKTAWAAQSGVPASPSGKSGSGRGHGGS